MTLKDILGISIKNIKAYPKRNLMIVAVMGIIFGLVLTVNLWLQGIENSYAEFAGQATDGRVIILATNNTGSMAADDAKLQATKQEMVEDIEKYGGDIIDDAEKFGVFGSIILPEELVRDRVEVDMTSVPTGAVPVLATTFLGEQLLGRSFPTKYQNAREKQECYEKYRESLIGKTFTGLSGVKYHVVGLTLDNFHTSNLSFRLQEQRNDSALNPLLNYFSLPSGVPIVIGSSEGHWRTKGGAVNDSGLVVAVFGDSREAYKYFKNGKGAFPNVSVGEKYYAAEVIAGMSPEAQYIFSSFSLIMNILSAVLGLIAIIVVIFTSIRLVDQDRQNIALYYSLGATSGQVRVIYLGYFLWLMIGAVVFAFGLASLVVVVFSLVNQELLGVQAMLGFGLESVPRVMWYGVNAAVLMTIVAMLLLSPVCVLINHRGLAATGKRS